MATTRLVWALRLVLALLLLPAVLSGGTANAQARLRCEVTQTVRASCCCPVTAPSPMAAISRSCCCTRVEVDRALPNGSLRATSQVAPQLPATLRPAWRGFGPRLTLTDRVALLPAPRPRLRHARSGPSLIVLHRRFLI